MQRFLSGLMRLPSERTSPASTGLGIHDLPSYVPAASQDYEDFDDDRPVFRVTFSDALHVKLDEKAAHTPLLSNVALSPPENSGIESLQWRSPNAAKRRNRFAWAILLVGSVTVLSLLSFLFFPAVKSKLEQLRTHTTSHQIPEFYKEPASGAALVSGYYQVPDGRKHDIGQYYLWIKHFLETVELPIVFYTQPHLEQMVKDLRKDKPITIISDWNTTWEMPPLVALGGEEWALAMNELDPEVDRHAHGVYGPWTAKAWMVKRAAHQNVYNAKYHFWVDAGGFREYNVSHSMLALADKTAELFHDNDLPNDTILLCDANEIWPEEIEYVLDVQDDDEMDRADCHIQGGFFGGQTAALDWWESETLRITRLQSSMERFAGKEQDTWTHTARLNWKRVAIQNNFLSDSTECGEDPWFAYEYYADSPKCQVPLWNGPRLWREYRTGKYNVASE